MIKNFNDWNNLNESKDDILEISKRLCKDHILKNVLIEVEEGKYPIIKMKKTNTSESYVAVCLDIDNLLSEVYNTENPEEALIAIIIKTTKKDTVEDIVRFIKNPNSGFLIYDVYAGDKKLTPQEIANKYNLGYNMTSGDAVPYYTSTPVVKQFHVY